MDPNFFLKAPMAPTYTNFESATKKNVIFWSRFTKKMPKTTFSACFFKILLSEQKFWPKQGPCSASGELGKSASPTQENLRSAPATVNNNFS